jgi:hypothetical protein
LFFYSLGASPEREFFLFCSEELKFVGWHLVYRLVGSRSEPMRWQLDREKQKYV